MKSLPISIRLGVMKASLSFFGAVLASSLNPASDSQASDLSAFPKRRLVLLSTKTAQPFLP